MDSNKGSILITTLWIIAILSLLAMGIGFRSSLEVRLSKYNMDKLQAQYLAKAGIEKARERLLNDGHPDYDTLYECGISLEDEETPESIFGAQSNKLGDGSFSVGSDAGYGMIDEDDIYILRRFAARNVAKKIGIPDVDFKTCYELTEEINRIDKESYKILTDFFDSYQNWYKFHKSIEQKNLEGKLSQGQKAQLEDLMKDRDQTRSKLIKRVNDLPNKTVAPDRRGRAA